MKVLLDIKEEKVGFLLELLSNFKFVKAEPLTPYKSDIYEGIREGLNEMAQIQEGKIKGIPARELLNEI